MRKRERKSNKKERKSEKKRIRAVEEWSRLAGRHTGPHCLANSKRKLKKVKHLKKIKKRKDKREERFFLAIIYRGDTCVQANGATDVNSFGALLT